MTVAARSLITTANLDAKALEGYARRQLRWDPLMAARVVTTPRALGVFTAPPMGVLAFMAVPVTQALDEQVETVVGLLALAECLPLAADEGIDLWEIPQVRVAPGSIPSVLHLPPEDGWHMPLHAVAGDLIPLVSQALAEFEARSVGLSEHGQQSVAEEIWSRPAWGGLPMRVLHAAYRLGFIPQDMSRVSSAANGPWRRFTTVRGQVFSYDRGPAARLALHLVK